MNAELKRLADRFDAYSMRERVMVFAATAAVIVFVANLAMVEPQVARARAMTTQMQEKKTLGANLDLQSQALKQTQASDPDVQNRNRVTQAQQQLSNIEAQFLSSQKGLIAADRMASLLETVLRQHRGLQLVELRTLAPVPLIDRTAAKSAQGQATPGAAAAQPAQAGAAAQAPAADIERNLYKHGFELTVRGSYPEFVQYLAQLEKLPSRMYWGKVIMTAEEYPRVLLTITIYTLSLDKAWLVL